MTRLGRFVTNIFATIFGLPLTGAQSIFSIILDWTAAMYAEFVLIVMRRIETDFAPTLTPMINKMEATGKLPSELKVITDEIKNPSAPIGALLGNAVGGGMTGGLVSSTIGPWLLLLQYEVQRAAIMARFDPKTALAIKFRRPDKAKLIESDLKDQGWSEERSELLMDVAKSRLKEELLVTLRLRGIVTKEQYTQRMYVLGYDATEAEDLYKSLLEYPGISDIVRMAVREAYTPEIAEKFGQYQDIPPQFITEAAKVGIPEEIARQYWAAHWDLPSPMQGFEMLHRGIITQDELKLLLRALDVMPFWRDKLINLAYTTFTRVDIRRMHKLGILTEAQVKTAYMDIGYNAEKAAALTRFTLALNADTATAKEKDLTKAEMVSAFKKRIITEGELSLWLKDYGYVDAEVKVIIDSSRTTADVATRDLTLAQIQSLYQKGLRSKVECNEFLLAFGYDAAEITALYSLWDWEQPNLDSIPSKADQDKWIGLGLITLDEWSEGYTLLGYDLRWQELYFATLVETGKIEG